MLGPHFPPDTIGGAERSTMELVEGLCSRWHTVHVLAPSQKSGPDWVCERCVVERIFIENETYSAAGLLERRKKFGTRIRKIVFEQQIDLIHDSGGYLYGDVLFDLRKWYRGPIVVQFRTCLPLLLASASTDPRHLDWALAQEARTIEAADVVVCAARHIVERFIERYGVYAEQIKTGILPRAVAAIPTDRHDGPRILLAGRLSDIHKGATAGLNILKSVFKRNRSITVAVTTSPAELWRWLEGDRELSMHFQAVGLLPQSEFDSLVADSDIVLVPSTYDCFPRMVLEAMASARVPAASSMGGAAEIISPGENGYTFDLNNDLSKRKLVENLLSLCADRRSLAAMGVAAREEIRLKYDFNHMLDALGAVYARVTEGTEKQS